MAHVTAIIEHEADNVTMLLNSLYNELKEAYKVGLPDAGDMGEMSYWTLNGRAARYVAIA